MGYRKHALAGFSWQSIQKLIAAGLSLGKIMILARLLSPEQFGLFSLVMIALGTTESITQTGVNITMLQAKQSVTYFLDTAFVIAIIRGLVIGSLMVLMGYLMANYYHQPELLMLIAVVALVPIIKGFINPAIISWQKNFQFSQDSFYHLLRLVVEATAQILLAWWLHSVWALVLGVIVSAAFEVGLSFWMRSERPKFHYIKSRGTMILSNARWLSLSSLLHYLNDNVDDFLLGKIVGTHRLGIYHNAYALSHKVNYDLSKSAYHGVAPVFNKLVQEGEEARLRRAFRQTLLSTLGLTSLLSLPLLIWPGWIVELVLGSAWSAAAPILPWLALAGVAHSISNLSYALLIAKKQYLPLNLHLLSTLVLVVAGIIYFGQHYALLGAVLAILAARVLTLPVIWWGVRRSWN